MESLKLRATLTYWADSEKVTQEEYQAVLRFIKWQEDEYEKSVGTTV